MKKAFIISGSFLLIGGLTAFYFRNVRIPKIKLISVDWNSRNVIIEVRGERISLNAKEGLGTVSPIKFSKYKLNFEPSQLNTKDIYGISINDGSISVGQMAYVNFKDKTTQFFNQ